MKRIICLSGIILIVLLNFSFIAQQKKSVIFFGDSITQAGAGPKGYITVLRDMLEKNGRGNDFDLIGAGVSGNKVYDLYLRLEEDVLSKKPDIVFIYVGINDVWHKKTSGTGTDLDKYLKFYNRIIDKIQEAGGKIIVCTPSVIGEQKEFVNELDGDLNKYSVAIRNMAQTRNVPLLDLRKEFVEYENLHNPENLYKGVLTIDGVHLNEAGNMFVAELMMPFIK